MTPHLPDDFWWYALTFACWAYIVVALLVVA